MFSSLCFAWEYRHSAIGSSIWRNHAMSGQPNRDLFFSQSKKSGSGPAQAGAASLDSCPGLVIRFLVACCLTGLSLRLLSLFSQDSCFTSRQKEKENIAGLSPSPVSSLTKILCQKFTMIHNCFYRFSLHKEKIENS